jgi:glycine cleavage system aminomethyltransferase T
MSVSVPSSGASDSLQRVLRRAGAVFSTLAGRPVAINYGSAAGELAVLVSGVGLVDRSELSKLIIDAPPAQLDRLTGRLLDAVVAPGGALRAGGTWWCRATHNRIVALSEPESGRRLGDQLRAQSPRHAGLVVRDRSADVAAIELLGRNAHKVLRALGAYGESGDPRGVSPFRAGTVEGIDVLWLLQSDRRALALTDQEHAAEAWRNIEHAGHELGISCVGVDAADRYALLERAGRSELLGAR